MNATDSVFSDNGATASSVKAAMRARQKARLERIMAEGRYPTLTDIARHIGVQPSTLTRFYNEDPDTIRILDSMTLELLNLKFGDDGRDLQFGFEDEALPYIGPNVRQLTPNQTIWTVKTCLMVPRGLMPDDKFILDQAREPTKFDIVIANVYNSVRQDDDTLLRVFYKDFLYSPLFLVDRIAPIHVNPDDETGRVKVMGVVIESWRS